MVCNTYIVINKNKIIELVGLTYTYIMLQNENQNTSQNFNPISDSTSSSSLETGSCKEEDTLETIKLNDLSITEELPESQTTTSKTESVETTIAKNVVPFCTWKQNKNRVHCTFNGSPTKTDCELFFEKMNEIYSYKKEFLIYFDAKNLGTVNLKFLNAFAEYMKCNQKVTRKYMRRAAIRAGRVAKIVINLLFKIRPPVTNIKVFDTEESAKIFLREENLALEDLKPQ